jgi:hypothetical protein
MTDDDRASLEAELQDVELQIDRLTNEVRGVSDDLREGDEAGSSRIAVEQLTLIESLERRRAQLQSELAGTDVSDAIDVPAPMTESPAPRGDELTEALDVDDPVEALEVGALSAATEDNQNSDPTELADRAAPPAPEETLVRAARTASDVDHVEVGLPPGIDLDVLEDASLDDLIEAGLAAVDEADPETVAIIRDEIEQRQKPPQ